MATKSANDDAKLPMKRGTAKTGTAKRRIRKIFGDIHEVVQMPNLIEVQRESYEHFLQMHTPADKRTDDGLGGVFKSVFPISDFSERATLEYVSYEFETPKFDVEECRQRDLTYSAPLKVTLLARDESSPPPFEVVREAVHLAWRREQDEAAVRALLRSLRQQYPVTLAP